MQTQQVTRVVRAAWLAVRQLNVPRLGMLCLAATLAIALIGGTAQAQYVISQQGRLLGSGGFAVPPGTHTITVRFWTKSASSVAGDALVGSALVANGVQVTNGVFTAPLGVDAAQMTALASASTPPAYVSIQVDSDAELSPRIPLADVPFALNARQAFTLSCSKCVTGAQIADGTIGTVKIDPAAVFATVSDSAGNAANTFSVANNNNGLKFAAGSGATVAFDKTSHTVTFDAPLAKGGTVTSVGTGAGLTGGPFTDSGTISIATGGVSNTMLANSGITITTGTGLSGGGTVALGGSLTLSNPGVISVTAQAPLVSNGGKSPADISLTAGTAAGQALLWNGSAWSAGLVDATKLASGTLVPIASGGTGMSTGPTAAGQFMRSTASGTWGVSTIQASDFSAGLLSGTYIDKTTDQTATGVKTWNSQANFGSGIALTNSTSNLIKFPGTAVLDIGPAMNSNGNGSTSTKIVLAPGTGASQTDYAIGVEGTVAGSNFFAQWASVPQALSTYGFRWYGGTTPVMVLKGDGTLTVATSITSPTITASTGFVGNGSGLTNLDPTKLTSGHIPANVTLDGQAATVANGVYTTGSYTDPAWIVSLAASKLTGSLSLPGNGFSGSLAGDVTGGQGATLVGAIQGKAVTTTAPTVNQVLMWNGTAWTPSAVGSASTTGIATFGTGTINKLVKWSNTTGALADTQVFDNGTNVGINQTTPTAKLDVNGTFNAATSVAVGGTAVITQGGSDARASLHYVQATNADGLYLGYNGGGGGIHFYPNSGSTETMTVSGSNVGIGVTTPSSALQIANAASLGFPSPGATAKGAINIRMGNNNGYTSGLTFSGINADNAQAGLFVTADTVSGTTMYLATTSANDGPQARVTVSPAGSVGVGTTTPGGTVDIAATQPIALRTDDLDVHADNSDSTDRAYFRGNRTAGTLFLNLRQAGGGTMYLNFPGNLSSGTVDTRLQDSIYISPTNSGGGGNVGIGNTASFSSNSLPTAKLDVAGDIRASGVHYATTTGATAGASKPAFCTANGCFGDYGTAASIGFLASGSGTATANGTLRLGTGAADISGNGANIGIGTTSAAAKLQVTGGNAANVSFVTDGFAKDNSGIIQGNQVPTSTWVATTAPVSSGTTGLFTAQGAGTDTRVATSGPYGTPIVAWNNAASTAGGWSATSNTVDITKPYRFSVWVYYATAADASVMSFGVNPSEVYPNNGTSVSPATAWFFNAATAAQGRWLLYVGYIHANSDTAGTTYSAVYDGVSGAKLATGTDYRWSASATTATHKVLTASGTGAHQFWNPRLEEINGKEPTITALVGSAGDGGTANYLPKYDGTVNGKVASQIYDNGTNVGVGNGAATPPSKFYVQGDIAAGVGSSNANANTVCWGNGSATLARSRTETLNDPGTANIRSGFYETTAPSPAASWYPGATGTHLIISAGYSGNTTTTFHNLQIVGGVGDSDLYYRKTNSVGGQDWMRIQASGKRIACKAPFNAYGATAAVATSQIDAGGNNLTYYNTLCSTIRYAAANYVDAQRYCFALGGHIMTGNEAYTLVAAYGGTIATNGDWMGVRSLDDTVSVFNVDQTAGVSNNDTTVNVWGSAARQYRCVQSSDYNP